MELTLRYGYPWDSRIGWLLCIGRPAERKRTCITPTRFLLVGGDNALYTDGQHICLLDTTQTGNWKAYACLSYNHLELTCSYSLFYLYSKYGMTYVKTFGWGKKEGREMWVFVKAKRKKRDGGEELRTNPPGKNFRLSPLKQLVWPTITSLSPSSLLEDESSHGQGSANLEWRGCLISAWTVEENWMYQAWQSYYTSGFPLKLSFHSFNISWVYFFNFLNS